MRAALLLGWALVLLPPTLWGLALLLSRTLLGAALGGALLAACWQGWSAWRERLRGPAPSARSVAFVWGLIVLGGAALAAAVLPRLADLERYVYEGEAKGGLGRLQVAVDDFARLNRRPPARLEEAWAQPLPVLWRTRLARTPHRPGAAAVTASAASPGDSGYWAYDPSGPRVFVDCTHTDSRGPAWAAY